MALEIGDKVHLGAARGVVIAVTDHRRLAEVSWYAGTDDDKTTVGVHRLEPDKPEKWPWLYEEGGFAVYRERGILAVYRPAKSGTHAVADCAFTDDGDGLSMAVARVRYLANRKGAK